MIPNDAVLAYVSPETDLEAPFDALLGQAPRIAEEDDGLYRPRPRPDPNTVLSWLGGRALGRLTRGVSVLLARLSPSLFGYQFVLEAAPA